jgi:2-dehydro-3-deoxy-L-rhamnonate dehydrogenase (NAD+)
VLGTVLVTGGASGVGAAVADALLEAGGTPVVLDRMPAQTRFEQAQVDLDAPRFAETAVREVAAAHPDLRGVVSAANLDAPGPIGDVDAEAWDRAVRVNVIGTAAVVRAALPALERNGGRLVAVAPARDGDDSAARASSCAVAGLTRALHDELSGRVGVTLVARGRGSDPAHVARAVVFALTQPAGFELRELVA